jgi:hypothetical protein
MNYFAITFAVKRPRPMPLRLGSCFRATPDRPRARAEPLLRLRWLRGLREIFARIPRSRDAQAAAKFKHAFEARFASGKDFPIDGR